MSTMPQMPGGTVNMHGLVLYRYGMNTKAQTNSPSDMLAKLLIV